MHSSSNLARVMLVLKSTPSNRLSISMVVCAEALRVRFARSQAVLRRRTALGLPEMSFLFLRLNSCRKHTMWCQLRVATVILERELFVAVVETIQEKLSKQMQAEKSLPCKDDH